MAMDAHLKLGTIKGESVVEGFEDQIQLLSISWGMSQTGSMHSAAGGGTGKVDVNDAVFTHYLDAASPGLALACMKGTHIDKATLTMNKAGGSKLAYMTLTMTDVMVSQVSFSGGVGDEQLTESFALNFAACTYSYQPQDNKGAKKGGAIEVKGDFAKSKF
jgi:type VI secretion system secreted protein Hcp